MCSHSFRAARRMRLDQSSASPDPFADLGNDNRDNGHDADDHEEDGPDNGMLCHVMLFDIPSDVDSHVAVDSRTTAVTALIALGQAAVPSPPQAGQIPDFWMAAAAAAAPPAAPRQAAAARTFPNPHAVLDTTWGMAAAGRRGGACFPLVGQGSICR